MRISAVLLAAVVLAGCGSTPEAAAPEPEDPPLVKIHNDCDAYGGRFEMGDEGRTISFDGPGKDEYSQQVMDAWTCVLEATGRPDSVSAQIGNTRALDGMQTAEWGDYSATWTYHPDHGLDMTVTQATT